MWKWLRIIYSLILALLPLLGLYTPVIALDMNPVSVNITITVSPLLPPTVTNGIEASNILDLSARLNGEITSTGNENPTATVFWGITDGSDNASAWSNNASLGAKPLGTFYYDTGNVLTASTLYYYRLKATNTAGTDWANTTANFTTQAPIILVLPPSTLVLTDLGGNSISVNWTLGANAVYTLIRISNSTYPATITSGQWLYYGDGTTVDITGWAIETSTVYVSAWGIGADNVTYSATNKTASIGGEGMILLATSLVILTLFGMACTFMGMKKRFAYPIFALSALASGAAGILQLATTDSTLPWVMGWVFLMIGFVSITLGIIAATQVTDDDYEAEYQAWIKKRQEEDHEFVEEINRQLVTRMRSRLGRRH